MLSHIVKPPLFNIVAKYAGKDAFPRGCAATSLSPESPFSAPAQRCCGKELLSREVCASTVKGESAEETSCCGCHCAEGKSGPAESCSERGLGRHVNLKVLIFYDSESHKAEALARGFARQISGESAFSSAADFPAVASARVLSLPPSVAVSDLCLASAGAFGRNFIEARVEPLQADVFEDLMDLNAALQEEKARAASGRVAELQPLPQPLVVFLFLSECGGKLRRAGEAFASEAAVARSDRRVSFRPLAGSSVSLVCLHEGAMQADTAPSAAGPSKSGRISNSTSTKTLKASRRVCALLRSLGAVSLRELCGGLLPDSPEASSCVPGAGDLSSVSRLSEAQFQTLALSCEAAEATTTQKFERWARLQKAALSVLTNRRRDKDGPSTGVALDGSAANPASRERASSSAASSEGGGCFSSGASLSESETESEDALEGLGGIGVGGSCGTAGLDGEADVEDLLLEVSSSRQQAALVQSKGTRDGCRGGEGGDLPEQLTASLRRNLEKEGYKMEWAWKQDDPRAVLDEAVEKHLRMIRELRGLPGLREDFFEEAKAEALHCALSLVGEPIMYPRVNELLGLMHERHISTFLVTNAQHPEPLASLRPVTQLYLSIDAATEADLKRLDRPLMHDSWQKFLRCIDILRLKKQRTVFRLTLVHGYNCLLGPAEAQEREGLDLQSKGASSGGQVLGARTHHVTSTVEGYAELVRRGEPDFIEIKGMTFCGGLDRSALSMENVPRHQQVMNFATQLCTALPAEEYALASEHEHSCSVLIAHTKYRIGGQWHTWIDYPKFFKLALSGSTDFTGVEYSTPSPSWGVLGAEGRGFDPNQKRIFGKGRRRKDAATSV